MDSDKVYNVLFLCTHNSARSIMAEKLIDYVGRGKFKGFSAGRHPATSPNPFALSTLQRMHIPTDGLYTKNWDEFARSDAPAMDFVITVCDDAAGEVCPVWPAHAITAHWGVDDPSRFRGTDNEKRREFIRVANVLKRRIELLASLPLGKLDRLRLQNRVKEIGAK